MKKTNLIIGLVLIVAAVGIAAYLFSSGYEFIGVQTSTTTGTSTGSAREISVEGNEFSFSPSQITVQEGERVKIIFKNVGTVGHNFGIQEFGVSTPIISPGSTSSVEFTAEKKGTFPIEFICSVPGHKEQGMVGQLTVE